MRSSVCQKYRRKCRGKVWYILTRVEFINDANIWAASGNWSKMVLALSKVGQVDSNVSGELQGQTGRW